jgi:hypothetical protein
VRTLKVVVAGLNSTMAETHEVHVGQVGEAQLHWFADRLRGYESDGWLRIGAVHHNPVGGATRSDENLQDTEMLDDILGGQLNLLLHGHTPDAQMQWLRWLKGGAPILSTGSAAIHAGDRSEGMPNQYQLIRIGRNGFTRYARAYVPDQGRWIGDRRLDRTGSGASTHTEYRFLSVHAALPLAEEEPSGLGSGDTFGGDSKSDRRGQPKPPGMLDWVAEVAELRHPDAKIRRVEESDGRPAHLLISALEDGVASFRVIGVAEAGLNTEVLDTFVRTAYWPYQAAYGQIRAVLVYGGERPADPALLDWHDRRKLSSRACSNTRVCLICGAT